ncbi:BnaAnng36620D [Brassica napus]|uniref:BnaAnng36620D protein n=2 Tax=Brassica TaxID=3705 RepID=A0A078JWX6_BRANA|nr:BnaAnng36620D [Brassica napus]
MSIIGSKTQRNLTSFLMLLTGNPLFPGKNIVHQLDMMNDLLGTPFVKLLEGSVRNEKAGRYLRSMRLKKSIRFSHKLPHDDPLDLRILQKLLSFELNERPTFEEGLVLTLVEYFKGVAKKETIYELSKRSLCSTCHQAGIRV